MSKTGQPLYHIGWDIQATAPDPVFAIADGVVLWVSASTPTVDGGWGVGNFGIFVKHWIDDGTPAGRAFLALYAHVRYDIQAHANVAVNRPLDSNAWKVQAGKPFATVGPYPETGDHLHFGIVPSDVLPQTDASQGIGWGKMWCPSAGPLPDQPNGFTNPWIWITSNSPYAVPGAVGVTLTPTLSGENAPIINSFTATPTEVNKGGAVVIAWNVTNATTIVLLSPDQITLSASGQRTFNIEQNTTFTLRATNPAGTTEQSMIVKVKGALPVIETYTVQPSILIAGQSDKIVLSWTVIGAQSVSIEGLSGQTFPSTGSVAVPAPTASTTYTLVATNAAGSVSQQIIVTISSIGCVVANVPIGGTLYLFEGPGVSYPHVIAITNGTAVNLVGRNGRGDWMKARALGREGWIPTDFLNCGVASDLSLFPTVAPNLVPTP